MSETFSSEEPPHAEVPMGATAGRQVELQVPFSVFAATLRPRHVPLVKNGQQVAFKGRVVMTVTAGHEDEVWLKLLKIRHGNARLTHEGWRAAIDAMRNEPAYPGQPGVR